MNITSKFSSNRDAAKTTALQRFISDTESAAELRHPQN
jgi:hypothetical protein